MFGFNGDQNKLVLEKYDGSYPFHPFAKKIFKFTNSLLWQTYLSTLTDCPWDSRIWVTSHGLTAAYTNLTDSNIDLKIINRAGKLHQLPPLEFTEPHNLIDYPPRNRAGKLHQLPPLEFTEPHRLPPLEIEIGPENSMSLFSRISLLKTWQVWTEMTSFRQYGG